MCVLPVLTIFKGISPVKNALRVFSPLLLDPDEVIYDDVPRENSDSEPGISLMLKV